MFNTLLTERGMNVINLRRMKINIAEICTLKKQTTFDYMISKRYINKFEKYRYKKKIILTLIPTHDNLGDHAIAYAGKKYLQDFFSDYEIIEINIKDIYLYAKAIRDVMNQNDMVFIIGGGNMGDLYRNEEWTRRFIIKTFDQFKIVNLPATVHFTNTVNGKNEMRISKKIYNSHPNLTILARDDYSYNFMKKNFNKCTILKHPDMVFYLDEEIPENKSNIRRGIMICLRKDKESYLGEDGREIIEQAIKKNYGVFEKFSTTVGYSINKQTREYELKKLWKKLSSAEVVITDRLHGMIFCAITGTPCIVLRSFDHKVMEGYRWIEDLNFIKLITEPNESNIINEIESLKSIKTNNSNFIRESFFSKLAQKIIC
jgi:pyruvyl transferase EpsI